MSRSTNSCRQCGSPLQEGDLFCGECGHPVTAEAEEPPRAEPVPAPVAGRRRRLRYGISALVLVLVLGSLYLFRDRILPPSHLSPVSPPPAATQNEASNRTEPVLPPPTASRIPVAPKTPVVPQPRPKKVRDRAYYENAANDAFKKRKCGALKKVLDQGLGIYPDSSKLWEGVAGYNLVCRQDLSTAVRGKRALDAALRAYQLDSSDQNAVNVGWIYQSMAGDWNRAIVYYERGNRYADRDPTLHYHMGLCYEALRNAPKAVESYELFLRAAPNHKYAQDARARLSTLRGY